MNSANFAASSASNCVPLTLRISFKASVKGNLSLYTLLEVIASNVSQIERIFTKSGICSPVNPSGYPLPSILSW